MSAALRYLVLFAAESAPALRWALYEKARKRLADGSFKLGSDILACALFVAGSNCLTLIEGVCDNLGDLTHELAAGAGYVTGGVRLAANAFGISSQATVFTLGNPRFFAAGAPWTVRYAVIYDWTHAQKGLIAVTRLDPINGDLIVPADNTLILSLTGSTLLKMG